jgi:hypothetical protein
MEIDETSKAPRTQVSAFPKRSRLKFHYAAFVNHNFKASLQRLFKPEPKETSHSSCENTTQDTESHHHFPRQETYHSSQSSSTSGNVSQPCVPPSIPDHETCSIPVSGSQNPMNLAQTDFSSYILPPQIDDHSYYRQSVPVIPQKFMPRFSRYNHSQHTSAASDFPPPPSFPHPQGSRYPNYNLPLPPIDLRTLLALQGLDLIHSDVFEAVQA